MPSNHLIPLSCPSSPAFNLSQHQNFSNESALCIRWPKYWSFSFNISPSNEHSGLITFKMDWLDLLAVQGTLKSLLQHHSSKTSILRGSVFFTVQLSHPYMTTGKTTALTGKTFVGKVMFLLFNVLSRLVITFLPRSKHLLISWLQWFWAPNGRGNGSNGKSPPSKGLMPTLLYSVPLTPQQATVDSCLCWRLLDTRRQVWDQDCQEK